MIGKALFSGGLLLSIALSGCSDLNSEPVADARLENESILAQNTDLGIPVSPPIMALSEQNWLRRAGRAISVAG
jgi:hypothetical protein